MTPRPAGGKPGSDPVEVDPKHYKVESDTPRARILRIKLGPREKSGMHAHPAVIAVLLTDCRLRFIYPDGARQDCTAKRGEVLDFPPTQHIVENLSERHFEAIKLEFKY